MINLTCKQGSTKSWSAVWTENGDPIDITGYSARMDIREAYSDATAVLSLTDDEGEGLTITGASGAVAIELTATQTAALEAGFYVTDLEVVNGDDVYCLFSATLEVTAEATK